MDFSNEAKQLFKEHYGQAPSMIAQAPGRVNLIGEHTDYNDGFVLPMALPMRTVVAFTPRNGQQVRMISKGYPAVSFDLSHDPRSLNGWVRYVAGVAHFFQEQGLEVPGFDAAITTEVPGGAGLSSSASLEVAVGMAMNVMAGSTLDGAAIARIGQRVENDIIGVSSGIMDQLISAIAVEGSALLIDCRSLEASAYPIPAGKSVVVFDTNTRRELETSAYGDRQRTCSRAAAELGVEKLRDATLTQVNEAQLTPLERRRARHVVSENERTERAAKALHEGDAVAFGELMNESHRSLRDDFEVSSVALDTMVGLAQGEPGCLGARMTGGGFGGCAVALVDAEVAEDLARAVVQKYEIELGVEPASWVVSPGGGASVTTL